MAFGKLEREVMNVVWRLGRLSVRDVFETFDRRFAYTTLMTTLQRLHQKGLLNRHKEGRAYFYSPRISPLELQQGIAKDLIEDLLDRSAHDVEPLLACIVDAVSEQDRAFLDELDRLIKDKKRKLQRT